MLNRDDTFQSKHLHACAKFHTRGRSNSRWRGRGRGRAFARTLRGQRADTRDEHSALCRQPEANSGGRIKWKGTVSLKDSRMTRRSPGGVRPGHRQGRELAGALGTAVDTAPPLPLAEAGRARGSAQAGVVLAGRDAAPRA